MRDTFDLAVVGAGAAGLYCAAIAGARGARVVLIDHAERLAEKIRISGGGRCNFTNMDAADPARYVSRNPHFARGALAAHRPAEFLALLRRHRIGWHEKHRGQLFCDDSSERIIEMLRTECDAAGVRWLRPVRIESVAHGAAGFELATTAGVVRARRLVVATGGLSIPKIGATDFGHRLARRFGLPVVEPRPALVPMTFDAAAWAPFAPLSGVALQVSIATGEGRQATRFDEDLLITHRGLSGPAVLQISTYWEPGTPLRVDLAPGVDLAAELIADKMRTRKTLANALALHLPRSLAHGWLAVHAEAAERDRRLAEIGDRRLRELAATARCWTLAPTGTEGWRKAEVTRGGVDTAALDPRTLEARAVPGLHFIGEVVDVTGWLGGYNFQWAWSSAYACAMAATAAAPVEAR